MFASEAKDIRIQSQFLIFMENVFIMRKKHSHKKFASKLSFKQTTGLHLCSVLMYFVLLCTVNIDYTHSDRVTKTMVIQL